MKQMKLLTILLILIIGIGQPIELMGQNKKNKTSKSEKTTDNIHLFTLTNGTNQDECSITFSKKEDRFYASILLKAHNQEDIFLDPITPVKITFVGGTELLLHFHKDKALASDTSCYEYNFSAELTKDEIAQFSTRQYYKFTFMGEEDVTIYNLNIINIFSMDLTKRYNNNVKEELPSMCSFSNISEDSIKYYTLSKQMYFTQIKMFLELFGISLYHTEKELALYGYLFFASESELLIPKGSQIIFMFIDGSRITTPINANIGRHNSISGTWRYYAIPIELTAQQLEELSTKPLLLINIPGTLGSFASKKSSSDIVQFCYNIKNGKSISKKELKKYQEIETTIILPNEEWGY